jgi:hypothetical protein
LSADEERRYFDAVEGPDVAPELGLAVEGEKDIA